jgi:outer membrane protein
MFSFSAVRTGLLCLGMFAISGTASAQSAPSPAGAPAKVAIVNMQRAVIESEEMKKASTDMEAKYKPRQLAAQKIETELQGIQQQLQTGQGKLTPQAEQDLQATGQRRQRELQHLSEDLQNDVQAERNDILQKAALKMQEVVKKLAEEKGYDVVVDTQVTIYFKPALEITNDAIAAYNKAHPVK